MRRHIWRELSADAKKRLASAEYQAYKKRSDEIWERYDGIDESAADNDAEKAEALRQEEDRLEVELEQLYNGLSKPAKAALTEEWDIEEQNSQISYAISQIWRAKGWPDNIVDAEAEKQPA